MLLTKLVPTVLTFIFELFSQQHSIRHSVFFVFYKKCVFGW